MTQYIIGILIFFAGTAFGVFLSSVPSQETMREMISDLLEKVKKLEEKERTEEKERLKRLIELECS